MPSQLSESEMEAVNRVEASMHALQQESFRRREAERQQSKDIRQRRKDNLVKGILNSRKPS